ncbi:unnamed protein product [Bemisia tabaci]|uniref:Coiled-coil domain-containing protein 167 n=1 Tax=Bemisia tabaci TaxID=7038 RepID=A0A9P0AA81_BEMTA|nr:unnamed protein product [Bemisia tabaci]
MSSESESILEQIQLANDFIETCLFRVETIEKRLKSQELLQTDREEYEKELDTLRQQLAESQNVLRSLYQPNRQSFYLAAIILLMFIAVYAVL